MRPPSTIQPPLPVPLLLLLSLVVPLATVSAAATPNAPPDLSAFNVPIYHNPNHHYKRANPALLGDWAVRERERLTGKYGDAADSVRRRSDGAAEREPTPQDGDETERPDVFVGSLGRRATTALSVAGYGTATSASSSSSSTSAANATATSSANSSTPTVPVGYVPMKNLEQDLEYFAQVGVGVPPQYMNVILDTGSADLWIASTNCSTTTGCVGFPLLNASASTSAIGTGTEFSVKYGSGSASGTIWKDYVSFAGYNVSNQSYALCDTVSSGLLVENDTVSGLMGLGFQTLAASGVTPFWQNLWQAGVLPFPGFAFLLTRFNNVSVASAIEDGGLATFGYLNETLYEEPINYVSIPSGLASYWVIPLDAMRQNGTNITGIDSDYVAIDTGTTLIGGPAETMAALYATIPGSGQASLIDSRYTGYWTYPCATRVNVSFAFGGVWYNMTADDFTLGPIGTYNNVSTCLGAFFDLTLSSTSRISWVIGAAFLKNVYSVYRANPASVGFALIASGNYTRNSTIYGNMTYSDNVTAVPNGIYGPSGPDAVQISYEY